jgi:hypothetical protein
MTLLAGFNPLNIQPQVTMQLTLPAGHLLPYFRNKDFTSWFLDLHNTTKQPMLRFSILHKRFVLVADPQLAAIVYGEQ